MGFLRLHEDSVAEKNSVFNNIAVRLPFREAAQLNRRLPAEVCETYHGSTLCGFLDFYSVLLLEHRLVCRWGWVRI